MYEPTLLNRLATNNRLVDAFYCGDPPRDALPESALSTAVG